MADIVSGFSGFTNMGSMLMLFVWFGVALIVGLSLAMIVVFILVQLQKKEVWEINIVTRMVRTFRGREKKTASGIKNFFTRKIGRFVPIVQEKYKFRKKNREIIPLIKDNNGMYHTCKIPTYTEIKKWYAVQHGIDLNSKKMVEEIKAKQKDWDEIRSVYLLPNPHENLEWLGNQCVEADAEFKFMHWWQSPTVMMIGTVFICFITFVVTMIISKKM